MTVLGIAQNGTANMGTVHPQLMGAAGDRFQRQVTALGVSGQNPKSGLGSLTVLPNLPEQAFTAFAGNGEVPESFS